MITAKHTPSIFILLLIAGFTLTACNTEQAVGNSVSPENRAESPANSVTDVMVADTVVWEAATFYSSTCAACHGQQGEGSPIAPPLSSETVQTAEREWVIESIDAGRPETAMVAWGVEYGGPLNSEQVAAMADFVQAEGWQDIPVAQAVSVPVAVSSEAIDLYATTCSGCHGDSGQGSNIAAPLNSPELRTRLDDAALTTTITNGRSGTQMPAWDNTLSAEEIDSLVTLIRNWDNLDEEQLAQMTTLSAECGPPSGMGMMGGSGMMGSGSNRGNCR